MREALGDFFHNILAALQPGRMSSIAHKDCVDMETDQHQLTGTQPGALKEVLLQPQASSFLLVSVKTEK